MDDEANERVEVDNEIKIEKENVKEIKLSELKAVNEPQHKKLPNRRHMFGKPIGSKTETLFHPHDHSRYLAIGRMAESDIGVSLS
ncbi:hypothetical protein K1719_044541 [Acacia pycnantha]|nr:hypothetical protein K1719_044541 [Acacia pycnantha]